MGRKIFREAVIVLIETALLFVAFAAFGIPTSRERLAFDGAPVTDQGRVQSLGIPNVVTEHQRPGKLPNLLFLHTARPRLTTGPSGR